MNKGRISLRSFHTNVIGKGMNPFYQLQVDSQTSGPFKTYKVELS